MFQESVAYMCNDLVVKIHRWHSFFTLLFYHSEVVQIWVATGVLTPPKKLGRNALGMNPRSCIDAWENVSSFNYGYFWYLMLNFRSVHYMNNTQVETLQGLEYQQCPGDVNCSTSPTLRNWKIFDRIYGVPWLVAAVTGFFGRFTPRLVEWSEFTLPKTNSLPLKIGRAPKGK